MRVLAITIAVLLATAGAAAPVAAHGQHGSGSAYAGAHIEFSMKSNAIVHYRVDGATMFESVEVQSQEKAESSGVIGGSASVSSVTSIQGSGLETKTKAKASVKIAAQSGATIRAHDNEHGIFVVTASEKSQYVTANLSEGSSAKQSGDKVIVTTSDGAKGAFLVVGDGKVTVNEQGNVTAKLAKGSQLVFRSYPSGERDSNDEKQENYIQQGKATAEVYVFEKGGEFVVDTVSYGKATTVTVTEKTRGKVVMTVERSKNEGKIIITSVSEKLISKAESIEVKVDGNAAAEVSSYSKLAGAIGGDTSKFLVKSEGQAEASADVLVAINQFSTRKVTMTGAEGTGTTTGTATETGTSTGGDGGDGGGDGTSTTGPGFGIGAALFALLAAAFVASRKQ